ncbi:bifunctional oligoribonuclease/PAP phosphatase NrnA [Ruminiclostridium herbifermentans]|uniref:Bifunctional oligoribonuclease/PAP phosphatase NrnA n=1 Tax=Ruminiclostridium herbifermentans TaxID=2488810 RepID=A0A4U7JDX2_9FIRM|nr:bifunctional oligoribonuclease/PAP phosphatase NrnA [Ruminiclostridium herbifermentans]QNU65734.1 bifunctional oligoribonuclease/PAP phosphatase NrnA [Ruminiclostridium herbifermentans]
MDKEIIKLISEAGSVAIFPHVNADGDAIGSSLALGMALRNSGKKVWVYMEEDIPTVYKFLPGGELAGFYDESADTADLNIALDTGDVGRLGSRGEGFFMAPCTINIDHHITNTKFAHLNHVNAVSASTGEITYLLLKKLEMEINADIATCLYTAIATDTGGFQYQNTTAETHKIIAELLSTGINVGEISQRIYDNTTYEKLKLTAKSIELLELHENSKLAVVALSLEDIFSTGAKEEDCDGLVNIGRSIESVEVSALIKEKSNTEIRVNLRSKNYVDVSEVAAIFDGGGHKRAAGCTIIGTIEEAKKKIIEAIKERL